MEFISELFGSTLLWCSLFIFGIIALFFWPGSKEKGESAWDVLHKKFAEGTLSVEEYQERKSVLEENRRK
jgi:uncharacterized membrane protein